MSKSMLPVNTTNLVRVQPAYPPLRCDFILYSRRCVGHFGPGHEHHGGAAPVDLRVFMPITGSNAGAEQ
jgi:hypothetical protein